jgi:hypothetical protein
MKRAAMSANALTLPPAPSLGPELVRGRQEVVRHGIFLGTFAGKRRTFYMQFDGEIILADECTCRMDYCALYFRVECVFDCPIDEHRVLARNLEDEEVA